MLPRCGYLNESNPPRWETNGCSVSSINATWMQCECTHLTNFAVLAPKSNTPVPTDVLALTADNISTHVSGLVAVMIILVVFVPVFALAWRRDRKEEAEYDKLRQSKQIKWSDKGKSTLVKQLKISFQKRHTWFSLIFRKT